CPFIPGLLCTAAADKCLSSPCNNGATWEDCQDNVTTCSKETCHNGGTCMDIPDIGPRCQCAAGYQGTNCEENTDECQSEPCQNGAICKDGVNAYQCFCVPGFQGYHCDLNINECASRPCQNNGTCLDEVDHYRCDCAPGFKGNTQFNIDECASMPCLNEGKCIDGVNSYECDCEGTGFVGDHCEEDVPECASDPCQHGATCLEGINRYTCLCWPGYEGENCQIDTDECEQQPCHNGGECFQRSNVQNYGMLPELSTANFSYETAAGFICHCLQGFTGDNCSVNVDECESAPCQHGGSCQDLVNSYQCVCPDGFTGVHCEVDIDECDSRPCQNGATCEDAANSYWCHCSPPEPGQEPWGGRDCDVRLVGCQQHQCQHQAGCVPILTDYGVHSYTCLCPPGWTGERCNTSTTFSFSSEGYIHLQLPGLHMQLRFRSTLPNMVLYYRGTLERFFSLELAEGSLQAKVKSGKVLQAIYAGPVNDGEWHQVTVTMDERLVLTVKGPGCEEGCQVKNEGHNHLIFLQPSSFQQLYVGGAPQEYLSNLSSRNGFLGCMEDLQVDRKLLLPQDLIREENKGLELGCTKKDWCEDDPCMQHGQCVDMWVHASCQCHRPYYGQHCEKAFPAWTFGHENTTSYSAFNISETHGDNFTISFLMRSLKHNGLLLQFCREEKPYLTIYLKEGTVAIYTGNHRALGNVSIEAGDVVYVGGLPAGKNMNAWGGHFKGCLQDIRLDHKHLTTEDHPEGAEVYQASTEDNMLLGCKSDNTCKDEPCFNGGQCQVTWNDFRCDCSIKYSGRLCETRLWCIDKPCFEGVRCVDLQDGYECLTEAIFQDNSLQYVANSSLLSPVTNITMDLRTRDENGILLRAESRAEVFCLGLLNSSLLVKLDSGAGAELLAFTSDRTIADGAWHHIQLTMAEPTQLVSRWRLTVDGQRAGGTFGVSGNLNFLNDTNIWLAEKYTGCLGEVRVGGVYLPLINVQEAPQMSRFSRLGGHEPIIGCQGAPICDSQPCLNQGVCQDQFNEFNCSCSPGWEGELCETEINECSSAPCVYGTCKDLLADYRCDCEPGYTGKDCKDEVDNCLEFSCVNGGICLETVGTHTCSCPPGYIGKQIDECESSPCLNGATCLDRLNHFQCVCMPGYSGIQCESNVKEHKERIPWLAVTIPLTTLCVLLVILVVFFLIMTARKKRQSEGTYSPSSQEVAGARLEMGSVLKVPPEERLI
uniref:Crumbs cell polarity complex component 2b n=1 Tax=Amphiprion percula TaxID=161767 RepID=A0A3P8T7V9_AMPPE